MKEDEGGLIDDDRFYDVLVRLDEINERLNYLESTVHGAGPGHPVYGQKPSDSEEQSEGEEIISGGKDSGKNKGSFKPWQ